MFWLCFAANITMPKWPFGVLQLPIQINLLPYVSRISREHSKSCYGKGMNLTLALSIYRLKITLSLSLFRPIHSPRLHLTLNFHASIRAVVVQHHCCIRKKLITKKHVNFDHIYAHALVPAANGRAHWNWWCHIWWCHTKVLRRFRVKILYF